MKAFVASPLLACLISTFGCGGGADTASENVQPINVYAGPTGNSFNVPFTSVTVCVPGNRASCQTISDVIVDTGSPGLRVLASALSLSLPQETGGTGNPIAECVPFVGAFGWGPLRMADVKMAGEKAESIPIQVFGDPDWSTVPAACRSIVLPGSTLIDTQQILGANGIVGVGPLREDLGPLGMVRNPAYYECPSPDKCQEAGEPPERQAQNPVAHFASDNNGVLIELGPVPDTGAESIKGSLIFGIGTRSNNGLGDATVYTTDALGYFTTIAPHFQVDILSAIDSGGPFIATFTDKDIPVCSDQSPVYCPPSTVNLSAIALAQNGRTNHIDFSVANADSLTDSWTFKSGNHVFNNIAESFPLLVDWGLPFFYGRTVFTAIEGADTPWGVGPYFAY